MIVHKMLALGLDYCLVEYEEYIDYSKLAIKILDRVFGVGGCGLIVVKYNPLEMICYLNNGERIPTSSNAIRCFSKYCFEKGLGNNNKLEIMTLDGIVTSERISSNPFVCNVSIGKPIFNNSMIRVSDELNCFGRRILVDNHYFTIYSLYMSDIETIIFVDDFYDIEKYAKKISSYDIFARKTNVGFVKVVNNENIVLKIYDKNIGFVKSGASTAAAAVVVSQKLKLTKTIVKVDLDIDYLKVEITKKGIVNVMGKASSVFSCDFKEEN